MGFRTLAAVVVTTVCATLVVPDASAQMVQATGTITDTWGNPLEGVQVDARQEDGGGSSFSTVTDEDGEYQLIGLETTTYDFTYTLAGYQGVRQLRELRTQGAPGRMRRRPAPIELEVLAVGQVLQEEFAFEAEGGTPSLTLKSDGMFEFEDAEGEGEGNYSIQDLSVILTVRDYDGPDDTYTITAPVVVSAPTNQFQSLVWGETTLTKK